MLIFACIACALPLLYFTLKIYMRLKRFLWKRKHNNIVSVGFFHPYCNAGGGGERVLWCAIRAIQNRYKNTHCIVYTGDASPGLDILEKAEKCFDIKLQKNIEFVYLKHRSIVEAKHYPYFTLLCQSIASLVLGFQAALKHVPDIYIDTMGYAWTYPIFRYICSCRVGAYVHYPTISTDMLSAVSEQKVAVNNRKFISNSRLLSIVKLIYYRIFSYLYSVMGRQSEIIMVNSSWTQGHILKLWKKSECTFIVYPPCNISTFQTLPLRSVLNKDLRIISIGQFRPEKNHELQLNAFKAFLGRLSSTKSDVTLVLIGSCRHEEDHERVRKLKLLSSDLSIEKNVEFKVNLTFDEVIQEMKNADISLHSMWNEHFGIGIVECMSAGLIMVAHDSGGPKLDIIAHEKTGFLAWDIKGYADALEFIWNMNSDEILEMRSAARKSVVRFSEEKFEESFLLAVKVLFNEIS